MDSVIAANNRNSNINNNNEELDDDHNIMTEESLNDDGYLGVSVKDFVVILFMLGLWLYSIILMFRAWNRILNFSGSNLPARTEKATVLWRWVLDHLVVVQKKKSQQEEQHKTEEENGVRSELPDVLSRKYSFILHVNKYNPDCRITTSDSSVF